MARFKALDLNWWIVQRVLLVTYSVTLLSRAFQAFFYDLPINTWLWDQGLMGTIADGVAGSWSNYLLFVNEELLIGIQYLIGAIWLSSAVLIWMKEHWSKLRLLYIISSILYILLVFSEGKEQFYRLGQYLEFGLQVWVVGMMSFSPYFRLRYTRMTIRIFTALTFIAHGLYAVNYYPRPGNYSQMTMNVLHTSELQSIAFLNIMGFIDFIVAILVLIPRGISRYAFLYCMIWGFLTAFARLWAHLDLYNFGDYIYQWGYEFGIRMSHFMGPLIGYIVVSDSSYFIRNKS